MGHAGGARVEMPSAPRHPLSDEGYEYIEGTAGALRQPAQSLQRREPGGMAGRAGSARPSQDTLLARKLPLKT